jgi:hypothetical protein
MFLFTIPTACWNFIKALRSCPVRASNTASLFSRKAELRYALTVIVTLTAEKATIGFIFNGRNETVLKSFRTASSDFL